MSQPRDHRPPPREPEAPQVDLRALTARAEWVRDLGQVGRAAARRRADSASWTFAAGRAARWFLPAAAAVALACWWLAARRSGADARPTPPAALTAGSELEARQAMLAVTMGGQP